MSLKTVTICSVGQIWPDKYPLCPPKSTLQLIIDIRAVVADPLKNIGQIDGTQEACQQHLMSTPGYSTWLKDTAKWLRSYLRKFKDHPDFQHLRIVFMCAGGFQRSVCTAIKVADDLSAQFPDLSFDVMHMTMELTRRKAEAKARDEG